ncbi:response regulator, partial [Escherichia coli]|nr:response regulator [Escherichia coli]
MSIPTKVVIIDDDKSSITVLANELKVYQDVVVVATASDSYDGEQVILKHKPQLIFLDIELPCISGLEFLATLHSKIDWDINIIFYTSYDKYMLQAFRMEAFDFLLKPINKDDLLLVMNRYYLNRKNAQPSLLSSIHYPIEKPLLITTVVNDKIILRPQNIGYFRYNSERKL